MIQQQKSRSSFIGDIVVLTACGSLGSIAAGFLSAGSKILDPATIYYHYIALGVFYSLSVATKRYFSLKAFLVWSPILITVGFFATRSVFTGDNSLIVCDALLIGTGMFFFSFFGSLKKPNLFIRVFLYAIAALLCYGATFVIMSNMLNILPPTGFLVIGLTMGLGMMVGLFVGDIINTKPTL